MCRCWDFILSACIDCCSFVKEINQSNTHHVVWVCPIGATLWYPKACPLFRISPSYQQYGRINFYTATCGQRIWFVTARWPFLDISIYFFSLWQWVCSLQLFGKHFAMSLFITWLPFPHPKNDEEVRHVWGKCVEKKSIVMEDKEKFEVKFWLCIMDLQIEIFNSVILCNPGSQLANSFFCRYLLKIKTH